MSRWSRDELEKAFEAYLEAGARAGASGDWTEWPEIFTEDATYIEHHFGEMHGREAIFEWISTTMKQPINDEMTEYPCEWYVIDEDKGWVVCCIQNRMRDPGDGSVHEAPNWTLLKYAGDNQWSWEEDIYNPNEFTDMIKGWLLAKKGA